MNWREFFKPEKAKVILLILLLLPSIPGIFTVLIANNFQIWLTLYFVITFVITIVLFFYPSACLLVWGYRKTSSSGFKNILISFINRNRLATILSLFFLTFSLVVLMSDSDVKGLFQELFSPALFFMVFNPSELFSDITGSLSTSLMVIGIFAIFFVVLYFAITFVSRGRRENDSKIFISGILLFILLIIGFIFWFDIFVNMFAYKYPLFVAVAILSVFIYFRGKNVSWQRILFVLIIITLLVVILAFVLPAIGFLMFLLFCRGAGCNL